MPQPFKTVLADGRDEWSLLGLPGHGEGDVNRWAWYGIREKASVFQALAPSCGTVPAVLGDRVFCTDVQSSQ